MAKKKSTENKTTENQHSVTDFLKTIKDVQKRNDCLVITELIAKHTGYPAKMWGTAIVGFGKYHYKYASGREGDAPLAAFSPRVNAITLYLSNTKEKLELLKSLGKHKVGGGCVYIQKLEDIDTAVFLKMVDNSIRFLKKVYPD